MKVCQLWDMIIHDSWSYKQFDLMASGLELRKRSSFLVPYICSFMLWETPTKFIELLILCTSNCLNCFKSVIVLIVLSQFSTFQIDWGKISLMQRLLCHDKKKSSKSFFQTECLLRCVWSNSSRFCLLACVLLLFQTSMNYSDF